MAWVDANFSFWTPAPDGSAYVLGTDGNLWKERAGWQQNSRTMVDHFVTMFAPDGNEVRIENQEDADTPLEVLLIAGVPLNETIARYGPFVMNTEAEIHQAVDDYRRGRMGAINS